MFYIAKYQYFNFYSTDVETDEFSKYFDLFLVFLVDFANPLSNFTFTISTQSKI